MSAPAQTLPAQVPDSPPPGTERPPRRVGAGMLDPTQLWRALPQAFTKLNPVTLFRNPVLFVIEVGSVLTTVSPWSTRPSSPG